MATKAQDGRLDWNHPSEHGPAPSVFALEPLVQHALPDAFFVHDDDGRIIEANRNACGMTGYTRAELLGMSVPDLDPDFSLASAKAIWSLVSGDKPVTLERRHRRKDGSTLPVLVRVALMPYFGQRLYLCIVRNLAAEAAAR